MVKIADGDTLTIFGSGNTQYKIRLNGIDALKKSQAFGQKSKERLSSLVFNRDVVVKWKSKDKYGRILGAVFVGNVDINQQMLRDGMAWHYKRFDANPAYAAAEMDARQNRRGLRNLRRQLSGARLQETRRPLPPRLDPRPVVIQKGQPLLYKLQVIACLLQFMP